MVLGLRLIEVNMKSLKIRGKEYKNPKYMSLRDDLFLRKED